ncbi:MAG: MotA/TolQ/ExbB proton channel family protein [Polyangiaceae bacterium]|nr:MotA/TolQ/ExbB proton channel family protein [Polyangiaceae bacterium]
MSFDLVHIWGSMSILAKSIAFTLMCMGIASIAVVVERSLAMYRSAKESAAFAKVMAPLLDKWNIEEILLQSEKFKHSALAKLFGAVIEKYLSAADDQENGNVHPVDLARSEAARRQEAIGEELRRGTGILASVGSVAPFVGLLGTVVGIIAAFQGIASTGSGGLGAVSSGISEALIETAFGLMVAIPAVLFFNYLTARVNSIETALARSVGELLDDLENHHGRQSHDRAIEQEAA